MRYLRCLSNTVKMPMGDERVEKSLLKGWINIDRKLYYCGSGMIWEGIKEDILLCSCACITLLGRLFSTIRWKGMQCGEKCAIIPSRSSAHKYRVFRQIRNSFDLEFFRYSGQVSNIYFQKSILTFKTIQIFVPTYNSCKFNFTLISWEIRIHILVELKLLFISR